MTSGKHLLVIDDDAAFARLLQKDLERHGYAVLAASDGANGLARLADGGIDAIVLDHNFPGHDGLSVLAAIRQLADAPPVVYLTATAEARVAVAALKAGAADFVVKDVQGEFLALLRIAIDGALTSAALRRAKEAAEAQVRAARDRFKELADERALLMREVNHRVGNSLALIASLLRLQGSSSQGSEIKAALSEAEGRIVAVAKVHRHLYTSGDVKAVALDQYLAALADDLRSAAGGHRVSLSLDIDPVDIEPDRAVALGVLVTELVINARKHAYPNGSGPIRIGLRARNGCQVRLSVEDDGVGQDARAAQNGAGLGKIIINAMGSKLGGAVEYDPSHKGTRAVLSFDRTAATSGGNA